jgi:hypothetical protein
MKDWGIGPMLKLLPTGYVLVAGGHGRVVGSVVGTESLASAALFDPQTEMLSQTNPMSQPRDASTATLLPDSRVLVVGGYATSDAEPFGTVFPSVQAFDPLGHLWTQEASMSVPRAHHTATLLQDGRVLVVGGYSVTIVPVDWASAEIYDPTTNDPSTNDPSASTWSPTQPMHAARSGHHATLLLDGRVLVTGGDSAGSAEFFSLPPNGTGCSTHFDCLSGFCVDGVCCDQVCANTFCEACSKARGAVADGTCSPLHDCRPYACSPLSGGCETSCQSVQQCASGYACSPSGLCGIYPPTLPYRDEGGCALSTSDTRARAWVALALLAAVAAGRRARRARR